MSGTDLSSLLSALWKRCPEELKQAFREDEARKRENYKKELAEWTERQKFKPENTVKIECDIANLSISSQCTLLPFPTGNENEIHQATPGGSVVPTTNFAGINNLVKITENSKNLQGHEFSEPVEMVPSQCLTGWSFLLEPRRVAFGTGGKPIGIEDSEPGASGWAEPVMQNFSLVKSDEVQINSLFYYFNES